MTLAFASYHAHLEQILQAALAAADPAGAVRRHLAHKGKEIVAGHYRYRLGQGRIYVIAAGKAALSMGKSALEVIGGEVDGGVFIAKQSRPGVPRHYTAKAAGGAPISFYEAAHPVSDESSVEATKAVIRLLHETERGDLVLCLLSGGASALLTRPLLDLPQWQRLTGVLLESGCTINELNSVRKQLDEVKGGGLAQIAAPAAVVSLILSDVVGNPLDVIGSGPTAPNPESPAEALTVLHRYRVAEALPQETWRRVREHLTSPWEAISLARFAELEVANMIVGDVRGAAQAGAAKAAELGFDTHLLTAYLEGEAREVGKVAAALAKEMPPGTCYLLGGETTVTVRGEGRGGRNQEVALAAALALAGLQHRVVASVATDGEDGPTDAAGAVISGETVPRAQTAGLNPQQSLDDNDSYNFFQALAPIAASHPTAGGLIRTGPTGTNVNDLLLILSYRE